LQTRKLHHLPEILYIYYHIYDDISRTILEYLPDIIKTISFNKLYEFIEKYENNYNKLIIFHPSSLNSITYLFSYLQIGKKSKKNKCYILQIISINNDSVMYMPISQYEEYKIRFALDFCDSEWSDQDKLRFNFLNICPECGALIEECYKLIQKYNKQIKSKNKRMYKKYIRAGYCRKLSR